MKDAHFSPVKASSGEKLSLGQRSVSMNTERTGAGGT